MAYTKKTMTVILKNFRLSFPNALFEAKTKGKPNANGTPLRKSYNCSLIYEEGKSETFLYSGEGVKENKKAIDLPDAVQKLLMEAFGGKNPKCKNWAIRSNTEVVDAEGERYGGYEDDDGYHMSPSVYEEQGPPIYRYKGSAITAMEASKVFYAGCYVNGKVNIVSFNGDESKGVTSYLVAIGFSKDGDPFSSRATSDGIEEFEDDGEEDDI